ncbi:MAG: Mur ligase family protein, partial [Ruegeria sp.]
MGTTSKKLSQLALTARGGKDPDITGLAVDSRDVEQGFLFAALPGSRVHGGEFIQYALRMGAAAILTDATGAGIAANELAASDAALIVVEDPRQSLACSAALWFGAQPQTIVAVTGTNGKTSVATFVRQIWSELGYAAVNLGTTGVEGAWTAPLAHTTPEPITLHRCLSQAAANGVTHAAMEASSHGLEQRRLDGVHLMVAGFSNFTQDHLDYHATFEAYFDAKAGLFDRVLLQDGTAVVNLSDPKGGQIRRIAEDRGQHVLTVGLGDADLCLMNQRFDATGQDLRFAW